MEKKFRLCPHGEFFMECPLCKDETEEQESIRIEMLVKTYNN